MNLLRDSLFFRRIAQCVAAARGELERLNAERGALLRTKAELLRGNAELLRDNAGLRAHLRAVHDDRHHDFRRIVKEMGILNYENMEVSGELTFLRQFLARCNDSVVFDVGAHHGVYSRVVHELCPAARIFAFEPHPVSVATLKAELSWLAPTAFAWALGAEEGTATIYDHRRASGSEHASLHRAVITDIHHDDVDSHQVRVRRLDSVVAEFGVERIDLLKIDTEGTELAVLRGSAETLRAGRIDVVQFEFNEMNVVSRTFFRDFLEILSDYDFFRMQPGCLLPIRQYVPLYHEIFAYQNFVCVRKGLSFDL